MSNLMFYPLAGHVYVAAHSAAHHKLAQVVLTKAGFGDALIQEGLELSEQVDTLLHERESGYPEDKNLGHTIHSACEEVERWMQTLRFRLRKAGFSHEVQAITLGHDLHAHDHNVSVIAQALRAIAIVRTMEAEHVGALGSAQSVIDLLAQGNTLLNKLYRNAQNFVAESYLVPAGSPVLFEFDRLRSLMSAWMGKLDEATSKVEDLRALGLIGYTPWGVGLPVGGLGFGVTKHERAKTSAPDPNSAHLTSGWALGRQGNNENLGQGWLPTQLGTVTGD